jgi:hypothetical protein
VWIGGWRKKGRKKKDIKEERKNTNKKRKNKARASSSSFGLPLTAAADKTPSSGTAQFELGAD